MDIRIFDQELNPVGVVDNLETVMWYIRYWKPGEFKIYAPMTDANLELLQTGYIVVKHDEYIDYTDSDGNVWRRGGEITDVEYSLDTHGKEIIEAKGYFLAKWLWKRACYPAVAMSGTRQEIINALVSQNMGEDADEERQFPQFEIITQDDLETSEADYSSDTYSQVGDEIQDICQAVKLGFDILINERDQLYGFYLYKGIDLTSSNSDGNTPCIFSRDFDNVNKQEYEASTENYKNHVYVLGKEDDEGERYLVEVDDEELTGLDRNETIISASGVSRYEEDEDGNRTQISDTLYASYLETEGEEELEEDAATYTFEPEINMLSNLTYLEDYSIGDRITCTDKSWGLTINSRITEIVQTYEEKGVTFEATFGESTPTLIEAVRKATK